MKRLLLLASLLFAVPVAAQQTYAYPVQGYRGGVFKIPEPDSTKFITVYYGVLMEPARRMLDSLWTDDPQQVEQGYCVGAVSYNVGWDTDHWDRKIGKF